MTGSARSRRPATRIRLFAAVCLAAALLCHPPPSPGVAAKTVSFHFDDIDGRPLRLGDYRGQWVLVAFWAPWCPLCKIQMPALKQLDGRPDLAVIGIGLDYDRPETLRTTAASLGLGFRIVAGGARRDPGSPHRQVGPVDFFPTSYLYDPHGELAMFIPGQVHTSRILAYMDNWRAAPAGPAKAPVLAVRTDRLAAFLKRRHGESGTRAYADWRALVDGSAGLGETDKLARVNDFFNRRIRQSTDPLTWKRQEYWATLGEVLGRGAGDSEDFVIAKYFTLIALGVPAGRMRLVYVNPAGDAGNATDPVHMVLAWYPAGGQEPLLLDNRDTVIRPASARADLRPVFSFNSEGVWSDARDPTPARQAGELPMWADTLRRARDEGFE